MHIDTNNNDTNKHVNTKKYIDTSVNSNNNNNTTTTVGNPNNNNNITRNTHLNSVDIITNYIIDAFIICNYSRIRSTNISNMFTIFATDITTPTIQPATMTTLMTTTSPTIPTIINTKLAVTTT